MSQSMDDSFYDYDPDTQRLVFTDRWSAPSPVDGVCLGEYLEFMASIERARKLTPLQIFAQNEAQLAFARRYTDPTPRAR